MALHRAERFSELVLRLFHTELEAVYEEYNRGKDNDYRLAYETMSAKLLKNIHMVLKQPLVLENT